MVNADISLVDLDTELFKMILKFKCQLLKFSLSFSSPFKCGYFDHKKWVKVQFSIMNYYARSTGQYNVFSVSILNIKNKIMCKFSNLVKFDPH